MARKRYYFETEETTTRKIKGYVEIELNYAQFYKGLVVANAKLNMQCSLKLLPFLFFEVNHTNVFTFDVALVNKFNLTCSPDSPYKFRTVRAAIKEMLDVDIIRRVHNTKYYIRPEYCWIGDPSERKELIKAEHSYQKGLNVAQLDDNGEA